MDLCIISCGSHKIWDDRNDITGAIKARHVYTGGLARKCKQYAETFYPDSWCILSAKYGFIFPDELIPGPYNCSFNNKDTNPINISELKQQVMEKQLFEYDNILTLAGKNYYYIICEVFNGYIIHDILKGKGIGYRMQYLNNAIINNKKILL